jgi:hypothetical protein
MNSRANHRDSHLGSAVQYAVQAFQHLRVLEAWPALHTWGQNLRHHPKRRDRVPFAAIGSATLDLYRTRPDRVVARLSRDVSAALAHRAGAADVALIEGEDKPTVR